MDAIGLRVAGKTPSAGMPEEEPVSSDFLVIGGGIAGLVFALEAAKGNASVCVVAKRPLKQSASGVAQGGIAAAVGPGDTFEAHIKDTATVGHGLCHPAVVKHVVERGPSAVDFLRQCGAQFVDELGSAAAHSSPRVVNQRDRTGSAIMVALCARVMECDKIRVFEQHMAVNLAAKRNRVHGAHVITPTGGLRRFVARAVILATGGAGSVYRYTTNPDGSTGDGVAMAAPFFQRIALQLGCGQAYRVGASITNMELVQFHPTLLFHTRERHFLITERVRTSGGVLTDVDVLSPMPHDCDWFIRGGCQGNEFMARYHPDRETAPRDVVSRAIDLELKKRGDRFVFLDISHKRPDVIERDFPEMRETCLKAGFDVTKNRVPVVPGAHYLIGGVKIDIHGRTDVGALYAIGETSCSGLHGANRLASNSLVEATVMGRSAAHHALEACMNLELVLDAVPPWDVGQAAEADELLAVSHNWAEVRQLMTNYVSAVRSDKRLRRARQRLETLSEEVERFYWGYKLVPNLVELRNVVTVALLIVSMAQMRKESRGVHYNVDHLSQMPQAVDTVIRRGWEEVPD